MGTKFSKLLDSLHSSFWFIPTLMVVLAILLSLVTIGIDQKLEADIIGNLGWVYALGLNGNCWHNGIFYIRHLQKSSSKAGPMPAPPELLEMSIGLASASIGVLIRDQGSGISEADLPRIFEQFYTTSRSHKQSGIGLGLAIARRIIEAQGGSITASSKPGQGAVFTLSLPLESSVVAPVVWFRVTSST